MGDAGESQPESQYSGGAGKGAGKLLWNPEWWGKSLPPPANIARLADPHIQSFDWLISSGLDRVIADLEPVEFKDELKGQHVRIWLDNVEVKQPIFMDSNKRGKKQGELSEIVELKELPKDCRVGATTYGGDMFAEVSHVETPRHWRRFRFFLLPPPPLFIIL